MNSTSFQQSVDIARPHTCLTTDIKTSGSLRYRYDDTQEEITVPNIWYNQPYTSRVEHLLWQAQMKDEAADRTRRFPPLNSSETQTKKIVETYLAHAAQIRSEAARMQSAGVSTHPVAASHIEINCSEPIQQLVEFSEENGLYADPSGPAPTA